ncbi:MAG: DUF3108 domain-containing protein [Oxalobacter sp.]|nr:DUF3108 domain-containing protein [Oxalobacter sp.]MBR6000972.1 DUF3108 domain-containing protein [Oxalobacter sp.]
MKTIRNICATLTLGAILASTSVVAAPIYNTAIPPSATLKYKVTASYHGMSLSGSAAMQWKTNLKTYSVRDSTTVTFFGNVLNSASSGTVSKIGLEPSNYAETKLHKKFSASINQATGSFKPSDGDDRIPFSGQVQDHSSVVWQLSAIANGNRDSFVPGSSYHIQVIGHRGVRNWTFRVVRNETLSTPAGKFKTTVVSGNNQKNQTMTLWLAKDNYHYPIQLYFKDNNFESRQTVNSIR